LAIQLLNASVSALGIITSETLGINNQKGALFIQETEFQTVAILEDVSYLT